MFKVLLKEFFRNSLIAIYLICLKVSILGLVLFSCFSYWQLLCRSLLNPFDIWCHLILTFLCFLFRFGFVLSRWPVSWENVGCWNHPLLLSFVLFLILVWKPSIETHVGIFYFMQRVLSPSVQKSALFLLRWPSTLEMSHNDLVVFPFVRATWSCFAWV